ncbi:M10 family metallopeptidase [Anabaena sp. WFMT]|uniref:M10 family metallopeptidase n=1 Tax=Anabaena sp. WFMT TaxID=3449730 RepID=UPI003F228542
MGTYNLSNLNHIDSLLSSGRKWGAGNRGTGAAVTYNFSNLDDNTRNPLTNAQRQRVRSAFNAWSEIANIQFIESPLLINQITLFGVTSSGGQTRSTSNNTGIIRADIDLGSEYDFASGSYSYGAILLHEIGHAIGLKHPHHNGRNGFNVIANQNIDTTLFSVMSYRSYVGQPEPLVYRQSFFPTTPMLNDIAAIQYIYGANWNTRNGNTTYRWNSGQQILETIWDGGGIDTIDWSNQSSNASINLNAGAWSQLGSGYTITRTDETTFVENRTLAIAFGVTIENATGGTGNDIINGNQVSNVLQGGNGNDFIGAWSGNDQLYGGAGNDSLYGDSGIDTLDGGNGDDLLFGHTDNQSVIDVLGIDNNTDYLYGGNGNDKLYGGNGNDKLYGGNGNDYIDGGSGNDYMEGGKGNDTYIVDSFSDQVVESPPGGFLIVAETDTVQSSISYTLTNNVENLTLLGTANLNGTGNGSYNLLQGNAGKNSLFGLGGDDTLYGNAGNDSLYGDAGNDSLYGGSGNDYIDGGSGNDYMVGGMGDDTYVVDSVGDQVVELSSAIVGSGTDTVQSAIEYTLPAFVENLILVGNFNIDGIGDVLNNRLQGNSGNNFLSGLGGNDILIGGLGNDILRGGEGNDKLDGGEGDDNLNGEAGNDILNGAAGYDILAVSGDFNYTLTNTQFIGEGTDTLVSIEEANLFGGSSNNIFDTKGFTGNVVLYGGAGDDLLSAGSGDDLLYGEEGADTLSGGAGSDYLFGGEENDSLIAGLGNDALLGGEGNDYLFGGDGDDGLNGEAGNDIINGGTGYDVLAISGDFNYTLTNTQFIGEGTDTLVSIEGANLFGGSSNNIFDTTEFTGDVVLYGGAGDDLLSAGSGDDLLKGEEGADTLSGSAGNDYLEGGDGNDLFSFAAPTEGIDLIMDFVFGVDKIGIDAAGFGGGLVAGLLSNSQFVLGTTALNGTDRFIYDQGAGALFFDQDGTGATAQVQFAALSNFSALSASDIFVV